MVRTVLAVLAAFFKLNDEQYVEIIPDLTAGDAPRFRHIAFATPDVRKLRGILEARGLHPGGIAAGSDRSPTVSISDPEGNELIFVQYTKQSIETAQRGKYLDGRISEHLYHVGLMISDLDRALAGLKTAVERGHYDPSTLDMHIGRNRKWQLNFFDPDGTRAELMEPKAQGQ